MSSHALLTSFDCWLELGDTPDILHITTPLSWWFWKNWLNLNIEHNRLNMFRFFFCWFVFAGFRDGKRSCPFAPISCWTEFALRRPRGLRVCKCVSVWVCKRAPNGAKPRWRRWEKGSAMQMLPRDLRVDTDSMLLETTWFAFYFLGYIFWFILTRVYCTRVSLANWIDSVLGLLML